MHKAHSISLYSQEALRDISYNTAVMALKIYHSFIHKQLQIAQNQNNHEIIFPWLAQQRQNKITSLLLFNSGESTKMGQETLHEVVLPRNLLLEYKAASSACCECSEAADVLQGPTGTERQYTWEICTVTRQEM